jgi:glycosyltransferase involved in cell wall biosynthesis
MKFFAQTTRFLRGSLTKARKDAHRHGRNSAAEQKTAGDGSANRSQAISNSENDQIPSDFDPIFYRESYPDVGLSDVGKSDVKLWHHFRDAGKREGRLGRREIVESRITEFRMNPSLETIFIITHEATRTGAPILALNTVQQLQARFNVVVVLLGPGAIVHAFEKSAAAVIGPFDKRLRRTRFLDPVMESAIERFRPRFAIAHSVESYSVLRPLAKSGIPCIFAVHEFASYIRPLDILREVFVLSEKVVFPARVVFDNAILSCPELASARPSLLTQGKSVVPAGTSDNIKDLERGRIAAVFPDKGLDGSNFTILGCGTVEFRKGVDIFIAVAAALRRLNPSLSFRFVWVGKGFDPIKDSSYGIYLAAQIERAELSDRVTFLDEVDDLEQVYDSADVLLLTSRFDPYPNVGIDAMVRGLPVICFANASGIADTLLQNAATARLVVPDAAAEEAAKVIQAMMDPTAYTDVSSAIKKVAAATFDMSRYVAQLVDWAEAGIRRRQALRNAAVAISDSGVFLPAFYDFALVERRQTLDASVNYVNEYAANLARRRGAVGFNSRRFSLSPNSLDRRIEVPLASYIEEGCPEGVWNHQVIMLDEPSKASKSAGSSVSLVALSNSTLEDIDIICDALKANVGPLVVVPWDVGAMSAEGFEKLKYALATTAHKVIYASASLMNPSEFDSICVIDFGALSEPAHQWSWWSRLWQRFYLTHLLGGPGATADRIREEFGSNQELSVVVPDSPDREVDDLFGPMMSSSSKDHDPLVRIPSTAFGYWCRSSMLQGNGLSLGDVGTLHSRIKQEGRLIASTHASSAFFNPARHISDLNGKRTH